MENKRLWLGILVMVLVLGMTAVGCDSGSNNEDDGFYGVIFNEASKNAVRERNSSARSIIANASEVDLFELFGLNDRWTYIHKDKPGDPDYQDALHDNNDPNYSWYRYEPENPDGEKRYWRDFHFTGTTRNDREVVEELYNRVSEDRYGGGHNYWTGTGGDNYSVWFTVNKFLDTENFSVSIGIQYGTIGIQSWDITLDDVDDIILEF